MSFVLLALKGTTLLLYAVWGRPRPRLSTIWSCSRWRSPCCRSTVPEESDALSASPLPPGPDARRLLQHLRVEYEMANGIVRRGSGQANQIIRGLGNIIVSVGTTLFVVLPLARLRAPRLPPQEQAAPARYARSGVRCGKRLLKARSIWPEDFVTPAGPSGGRWGLHARDGRMLVEKPMELPMQFPLSASVDLSGVPARVAEAVAQDACFRSPALRRSWFVRP